MAVLLGYLRLAAPPATTEPLAVVVPPPAPSPPAKTIEVPVQQPYVPVILKDCVSMTEAGPGGALVAGKWGECRLEIDLPAGTVLSAPFDCFFDTGGEIGSPVPQVGLYPGVTHEPTSKDLENSIQIWGHVDMLGADHGQLKKGEPFAVVTGKKTGGRSYTIAIQPMYEMRYGYKELESLYVRAGLIPVEVSSEDMTGYVPQTLKDPCGRILEPDWDFAGTLVKTDRLVSRIFRWPMWGVGFDLPAGAKLFAPFDGALCLVGSSHPDGPDAASVALFPAESWTQSGARLPCVHVTGDFDLSVSGNRRVRRGELIGTINGNRLLKADLEPEDNFNLQVALETLADNDWLEAFSFYVRTRLVAPPSPYKDKYLAGDGDAGPAAADRGETPADLPPFELPKHAPSAFESLYKSPLVAADVRERLERQGEPLGYVEHSPSPEGTHCAVFFTLPGGTPLRMPFDAIPLRFLGVDNVAGGESFAWECAIQGHDPREVSFMLIGVSANIWDVALGASSSLSGDKPVAAGTVVGTASGDPISYGGGQGNVVVVLTSLYDREDALTAFAEKFLSLK